MADLFAWLLYLPGVLIGLSALLRRRMRALAVLVLPLIVFSVEYGPLFLPHRVPTGNAIRVVTANLYGRNTEERELARTVEELDADVVAVQELTERLRGLLSVRLRPRFPYQALYAKLASGGLGIFSRFPIRRDGGPDASPGSCQCQTVDIDTAEGEITIVNAHPPRPDAGLRSFETSHQIPTVNALLRKVGEARSPVVLLGDLNIGDRNHLYRTLRSQLGDAHRDAGWGLGLTWAHRRAVQLVRIDYVLHDAQWVTVSSRAGALPGSDHRYVTADLVQLR